MTVYSDAPLERAIQCFSPSTDLGQERVLEVIERLDRNYRISLDQIKSRPGMKPHLRKLQTGVTKLKDALVDIEQAFPGALELTTDKPAMDALKSILAQLDVEATTMLPLSCPWN